MSTTSRPTNSSLAQRIAKVRNCMLVEVTAGVPVTNKTLFVSLCQNYEQQAIETSSCLPSAKLLLSSPSVPESVLAHNSTATLEKDTSPRQRQPKVGFSIASWPNSADFDDFADFDDGS